MLSGKQIICLSSINWDFNWQGHQEIMARFAAEGNTVLFVENTGIRVPRLRDWPRLRKRLQDWRKGTQGIRQVQPNVYVCSPVVLPFPYSAIAQRINRWLFTGTIKRWMKLLGFERPILWTFLPTRFSLAVIDELDPELVVYYCIADFEQLAPVKKVRRAEQRLLRRADVVFAQGEVLAQRCRQFHRYDVTVVPFGVNLERFEAQLPAQAPEDLRQIKAPRLGYVGALQRHVDGSLLDALAQRHPDWSIVLVGPQIPEFTYRLKAQNIHHLGAKPHEEIPTYIAGFDVCLIPYHLNPYTQTVYPTKLSEYLVLGKPVVSTPLPEVLAFNARHGSVVSIGSTHEEFEGCISEALQEPQDNGTQQRRIEVAKQQSWTMKVAAMSSTMEQRAANIQRVRATQWAPLLHQHYQHLFRRSFAVILSVGMLYLGIFHTPLVWWAAAPLKVSQPPQTADAIVVFAGGVGESGRAGQGYEERVQHAANLYKQGYATHLIFSSGYTFAIQEANVMRALAISLGVPESAILLEHEAADTVQNVALTHRILQEHGWRTILLVSSPYHILRASLVWRKQAPDIRVISTPIPRSRYYGAGAYVQPQQLHGILHECIGLLYYWWKGDI